MRVNVIKIGRVIEATTKNVLKLLKPHPTLSIVTWWHEEASDMNEVIHKLSSPQEHAHSKIRKKQTKINC